VIYLCLIAYVVAIYLRPGDIWFKFPFVDVVAAVSLVVAVWEYRRRPRVFWDLPHDKYVLGLGLAIVVSHVWWGRAVPAALALGAFIKIAFYYFLMRFALRELWQFQFLIRLLIALNVALAVSGIAQLYWGAGLGGVPVDASGRIQGAGIFRNPNDLALSLVMFVPFLLDPITGVKGITTRRVLASSCLAVLLLALYYAESRGATLALLAILIVYAFKRFDRRIASVLTIAVLVVFFTLGPLRFRAPDSRARESTQLRLEAWQAGLDMFTSHPVFGVGYNRFGYLHTRAAHNSFLHVLAELGIFGAFFWVGIYYWVARGTLARPPTSAPPGVAAWQTPLQLSLIGALVCGWFHSRQYTLACFTLVGLGACYVALLPARKTDVDTRVSARSIVHIVAIMIAAIMVVGLTIYFLDAGAAPGVAGERAAGGFKR
jgi:O-antigen ligase